MENEQKDGFARWYQANKEKLAEARKARYHSDPEYRAKAIQHARASRKRRAAARVQPTGEYAITLSDLLENTDITPWQFQEWRKRDYFPEPKKFGREIRFTARQQLLISNVAECVSGKRRLTEEDQAKLQNAVSAAFANWN